MQDKIERYQRPLKNAVIAECNDYPRLFERANAKQVDHYNCGSHHESLDKLTQTDMYEGRINDISEKRAAANV
jgi:hypothetical protein